MSKLGIEKNSIFVIIRIIFIKEIMLNQEEVNVGGQALIEGVMMRGKDNYTIAVRKESGDIKLITKEINSITKKLPLLKAPFLRGVIALFQNLAIGMKSLIISANEALPEEEKPKSKKTEGLTIGLMVISAVFLGMGLFVALPNLIIELGIRELDKPLLFHFVSGAVRMLMFIAYVYFISLMKDVKRVFQYHGAEHKAVNAFEAGEELSMDNVRKFTTYHPRCGTSFMFFVFFISIIIFALFTGGIVTFYPEIKSYHMVIYKSITIGSHILLLPLVAGISYEVLKLSFKKQDHFIMQWIAKPGFYIQKLTTGEPDDKQLEIALAALKEVVKSLETSSVEDSDGSVENEAALANESV